MHKCSECQKSFGQAGHLKIHMLTHSKERTYACVQCQRSWGGTWSPTVGRKYTTVKNAERPVAELVIWKSTCSFTMGRSHTNAHNTIMRLHAPTISEITSKYIHYKSQNSANGASTPQSNHQALQNISSPTVSGEKPHHCKECGSSFSQAQHLKSAHNAVTEVLNTVT